MCAVAWGSGSRLKHLAVPVLSDPSEPPPAASPLGTDAGWSAVQIARLPARVTALLMAGGALWAGTFDAGLYRAGKEVRGLRGPERFVNALAAHRGLVWAGTARGLFLFTPGGRKVRAALEGTAVEALAISGSTVLAATPRGVFAVDEQGRARRAGGEARATALAVSNGRIWMGTPAGARTFAGGEMTTLPLVFGPRPATSNWVTALAPLGEGVLAGTDNGGAAYLLRTGHPEAIRFADGLASSTNPGAAAELGGRVFLGTPRGVVCVHLGAAGRPEASLLTVLAGEHVSAVSTAGEGLLVGLDDGRVDLLRALGSGAGTGMN